MKRDKVLNVHYKENLAIYNTINALISQIVDTKAKDYIQAVVNDTRTPYRKTIQGRRALLRTVQRFIDGGCKIPLSPEERKARSLKRLLDYKAKKKKQNVNNNINDLI